jgi:class 3 adenylate cyclase
VALRTTDWLCGHTRDVSPGVLAYIAHTALNGTANTVAPPDRDVGALNANFTFLRPVIPDGRELLCRGSVVHQAGDLVACIAEVTDADGNIVALGQETAVLRQPPARARTSAERSLLTVLFTDIVGSTEHARRLGDSRWRELLEEHHTVIRKQFHMFKGREVKTTGDGFLATFDSPGQAVQCARAIRDAVHRLGLTIRVGLHTAECEVSGADVAGIAVHIASRIQSLAEPEEILVSGTVRDLVAGSGLRFTERGRHHLKGIESDWQLFALNS